MTGTRTTIPAVKAGLVAQLAARAALAAVDVAYTRPAEISRKAVYLGHTRAQQDFPTMKAGRRTRDEEYIVEVFFRADVPGDTAAEADLEVAAMAGELEDLLADDPSIGGVLPAASWARVASYEIGPDPEWEGYVALALVGVFVHARLT